MSGYTAGHLGDALAGSHFLAKPFTPAVLLQRVREVLDAAPARPRAVAATPDPFAA